MSYRVRMIIFSISCLVRLLLSCRYPAHPLWIQHCRLRHFARHAIACYNGGSIFYRLSL